MLRRIFLSALFLMTAACSTLPSEGPTALAFSKPENAQPSKDHDGFIVLDLNRHVVDALENRSTGSLRKNFGNQPGKSLQFVGVGDALTVTIWESSGGGLFSAPSESSTGGSRSVALPSQEVDGNGTISIPFAGRVRVSGLTLGHIEQKIVKLLDGKAIEPQAIVTMDNNISNSVTVSGDVIAGARIPLSQKGDRILSIIAAAGGARGPLHETDVTLTRRGHSYSVPLLSIIENPTENIFVRADDTITLMRDPKNFTALGATGKNALIDFETQSITLEKAVALAGGLLDLRSDPDGVFILRRESGEFARALDPSFPIRNTNEKVNVVYRANLRDPNTLFFARRFVVQPDDILYIAGASANEWTKFLKVIGLSVSTAKGANSL